MQARFAEAGGIAAEQAAMVGAGEEAGEREGEGVDAIPVPGAEGVSTATGLDEVMVGDTVELDEGVAGATAALGEAEAAP